MTGSESVDQLVGEVRCEYSFQRVVGMLAHLPDDFQGKWREGPGQER